MMMIMIETMTKITQYSKTQPHNRALIINNNHLTYKELNHKIIQACGEMPYSIHNKRVGLMHPSSMVRIVHYFMVHQLGGIPVMMNSQWHQSMVADVTTQCHIHMIIDASGYHKTEYYDDDTLIQQPNQLLHIGFTSGTTGLPKAYYRNEPSWIASYKMNETLISQNHDVLVAPGPIEHSLTLYTCMYALYSGRTFSGQDDFDAKQLIQSLESTNQATMALFVVPTMLSTILTYDLSHISIGTILSSGAKLSTSLYRRIQDTMPSVDVVEFFGTSEASFISYNYNRHAPLDSVGKICESVDIKLTHVDKQGIGMLSINSKMAFSGYIDHTNYNHIDWLETGDFAYVDKQGFLYLMSRHNERLIIGGNNIYPARIEQLLHNHPDIDEAIIIGRPHAKFGEVAVLLYTGEVALTYQDIRQYLISKVTRYEIPSIVQRVKEMTYTESGKIARHMMQEKYIKGELST